MPLKVVLNLRYKNPSLKVLPVLDNAPGNPQDFRLTDLSFCPKLPPHACSHSTKELSHLRGIVLPAPSSVSWMQVRSFVLSENAGNCTAQLSTQ